ncbi:MAG: hypothetical protein EBQ97_01725, partial [Bacteroidetes bacterium]|nr:hypothetical protein [Bacteroidota bacterium]
QLNDLGFDWKYRASKDVAAAAKVVDKSNTERDSSEDRWKRFFKCLKEHAEQHPDVYGKPNPNVQKDTTHNGMNIGNWLNHQREKYKRKIMTEEQFNQLTALGVKWHIGCGKNSDTTKLKDKWLANLNKLKEFHEKNKNFDVPPILNDGRTNPLYNWIYKQRKDYKEFHGDRKDTSDINKGVNKGVLEWRFKQLNDLGFDWKYRASKDVATAATVVDASNTDINNSNVAGQRKREERASAVSASKDNASRVDNESTRSNESNDWTGRFVSRKNTLEGIIGGDSVAASGTTQSGEISNISSDSAKLITHRRPATGYDSLDDNTKDAVDAIIGLSGRHAKQVEVSDSDRSGNDFWAKRVQKNTSSRSRGHSS